MSVTVALSGLDDIAKADDASAVAAATAAAARNGNSNGANLSRTPSPRASLSPSPTPATAAAATAAAAAAAATAGGATKPAGSPQLEQMRFVHHLPHGRPNRRHGLGWSGLPKQMSACSASTRVLAEEDEGEDGEDGGTERERRKKRGSVGGGEGRRESSSASTNHLDRLKMAVLNRSSRQSSTSASNPKIKKQYSNLFPCPMVKTLDMDSPEGSLSSLGIVSGLNPHHVGPFASNTSAALMRRAGALGAAARMRAQREAYQRARSVQSQTGVGVGVGGAYDLHHVPILVTDDGVCNSAGHAAAVGGIGVGVASAGAVDPRVAVSGPPSGGDTRRAPPGWARQASLPVYAGQHFRHPSFDQTTSFIASSSSAVAGASPALYASGSNSVSPGNTPASASSVSVSASRSPRAPPLKQAKSLYAQAHKLRRQVTICEDSISIADSQVFSRQGSRSDSRVSLVHAGIIGPHPPPRIPSGLSASPVPSCTGGGGGGGGTQQQQHQQQHSFTPSPVLPLEQQQQQQPTAASAQLPPRRLPSPVPSLVPSVAPSTYLGTAAASASAAAVHHHPPPRLCPMLPRQESSFTTEEINRY